MASVKLFEDQTKHSGLQAFINWVKGNFVTRAILIISEPFSHFR